ncbi:MAG: hypothetical protein H6835_10000 [Planctomycetes bacterium]|nr:hypothetical protein [Planctomycetota bacterium]
MPEPSRRQRARKAFDELGSSMETSIKPWLLLTLVVGVPILIWALIDFLVNGLPAG